MSKQFTFDRFGINIEDPANVPFDNAFYEDIYRALYARVVVPNYTAQIDVDAVHGGLLGFNLSVLATANQIRVQSASATATNPDRLNTQYCLREFLNHYPEFSGLLFNISTSAQIAIANAEVIHGSPCDAVNFIEIKRIIDKLNLQAWDRDKDDSERQSGNKALGAISETLLEKAFATFVDNTNFFKVTRSEVQSYGDFVLMCLPNNLWLSVKSNYARERLLASGFNNDILGVGFFEKYREFTSLVKIRNFQRAGFLAMYCPDAPVTDVQIANNTNTYQQVCDDYAARAQDMPVNINGQPFIRALSTLGADLQGLLAETDIKRRHTVGF